MYTAKKGTLQKPTIPCENYLQKIVWIIPDWEKNCGTYNRRRPGRVNIRGKVWWWRSIVCHCKFCHRPDTNFTMRRLGSNTIALLTFLQSNIFVTMKLVTMNDDYCDGLDQDGWDNSHQEGEQVLQRSLLSNHHPLQVLLVITTIIINNTTSVIVIIIVINIFITSDGVGRSGTYVLIDMVLNRMTKVRSLVFLKIYKGD